MESPKLVPPLVQGAMTGTSRRADARAVHVASADGDSFCHLCTLPLACCCCLIGCPITTPALFRTLPPRTEAVMLVYGKYYATSKSPGCYCVNPCGLQYTNISVNNRAVNLAQAKCADSIGNSLVVSGVVTYRVVDSAKAVLDMSQNIDQYVDLQAQAILKKVCSQYPYVTYDGSPSLITEATHLADYMRGLLQVVVDVAGVEVVSFMLNDLSYAPEIASLMLVRQQAAATVDARKLIVTGAVAIACDALDALAARGKPIATEDASRFTSNLVMVIASESKPLPTIGI